MKEELYKQLKIKYFICSFLEWLSTGIRIIFQQNVCYQWNHKLPMRWMTWKKV